MPDDFNHGNQEKMFQNKVLKIQKGLEKIEEYKCNANVSNSTISMANTNNFNEDGVVMFKSVPYFSIFIDELCEFYRSQ